MQHTLAFITSVAMTFFHLDFDMTTTHEAVTATVLTAQFAFNHFRMTRRFVRVTK